MKEHTSKLLDKAEEVIAATLVLVDSGYSDIGAGRAYYAMFYVAEALLYERGLAFSKHSAVHAAFGKEFAKTGDLDPQFHRWLIDAFDRRLHGDYQVDTKLNAEVVMNMVEQAREFLAAARSYLD